jgi:hypothetical protein
MQARILLLTVQNSFLLVLSSMKAPDSPAYAAIYAHTLMGDRNHPASENLPPHLCRCDSGELVARKAGYHPRDEPLARFLNPSCSVEVERIDIEIFLPNEFPAMPGQPSAVGRLYDEESWAGTIDGHRTKHHI